MFNCFFVSNFEGLFEEDVFVLIGIGFFKLFREGVFVLDIGLGVWGRELVGVWKV